MQIDYFTIIAQIINFLVLVFLLRHFLYRPVIKSMDEREQQIASRFKDAEQKRKEAEAEADSYRQMMQDLSNKRQDLLTKATTDTQNFRNDLMKKAREEVEASKADWYDSIERQRDSILADLSQRAGEEVYAIASRALQDLANEKLEAQIIDNFILRLQKIGETDDKTKEFYKTAGQQITVRSTFEIPDGIRQKIQGLILNRSGFDSKIQFKTAPELISGIEITGLDTRISWNIASYLDALKNVLSGKLLQSADKEKQPEGGIRDGNGRK